MVKLRSIKKSTLSGPSYISQTVSIIGVSSQSFRTNALRVKQKQVHFNLSAAVEAFVIFENSISVLASFASIFANSEVFYNVAL